MDLPHGYLQKYGAFGEETAILKFLIRKKLSVRKIHVIEGVFDGLRNKQIADRLFVCEKTIKFHLSEIYKILNVPDRRALIAVLSELKSKNAQGVVILPTSIAPTPNPTSKVNQFLLPKGRQ